MHIKSSVGSQDDTVLIDTSTGKLKADLIDAKTVVAEGIDAKTIVAEGISGQTINADNATISNLSLTNAKFSGYITRTKTNITKDNIDQYLVCIPEFGINWFNMEKSGNWIEFSNLTGDVIIYVPDIYARIGYEDDYKEYVRSMLGQAILIQNKSENTISLSGNLKETESSSPVSPIVKAGYFIYMKCEMTVTNGEEDVYWLYKVGKTNEY